MRIISMNSKLCMKCMLEADWSFLKLVPRERPLVHRGVFLFVLTKTLPPLLVRRLAVVTVYMACLLRCFALIAYLFSVLGSTGLPDGNKTSLHLHRRFAFLFSLFHIQFAVRQIFRHYGA